MTDIPIINKGGGGSVKAGLPAIYVDYPPGSVCTCSNGDKIYTAKDNSGLWLFSGLELGEWTVTATQGANSKSQLVSITTAGQLERVTLSYELVLFDGTNGGDNNAETGGWTKSNLNTFTVGTNSIYAMYSESGESMAETSYYFRTKNKIDLTNYSTLTFVLSDVSKEGLSPKLGVSTATNMETKAASTTVANGTRAINISSLTGSYYIGLEETHTIYGEYSFEANITKVVLS